MVEAESVHKEGYLTWEMIFLVHAEYGHKLKQRTAQATGTKL